MFFFPPWTCMAISFSSVQHSSKGRWVQAGRRYGMSLPQRHSGPDILMHPIPDFLGATTPPGHLGKGQSQCGMLHPFIFPLVFVCLCALSLSPSPSFSFLVYIDDLPQLLLPNSCPFFPFGTKASSYVLSRSELIWVVVELECMPLMQIRNTQNLVQDV